MPSKLDLLKKIAQIGNLDENLARQALEIVPTAEDALKLKGLEKEGYLKALDAVYGSKEQRAAEMGFSPETWYHGTTSDIKAFKPELMGSSTGRQDAQQAFFASSNPRIAELYANRGQNLSIKNIRDIELDAFHKKWADIEKQVGNLTKHPDLEQKFLNEFDQITNKIKEREDLLKRAGFNINETPQLQSGLQKEGANILPVRLKPGQSDVSQEQYIDYVADELKKAKEQGKESLILEGQHGLKDKTAAVFKPEQIRSTSAAFDPRFKDSPYLSSLVEGALKTKDALASGLHKLGAPQRYLFNQLAESMGVKGSPEESEKSSQAIVEKLAEELNLLKDSTAANVAKALGVAGMEVFGDPLNFIGAPIKGLKMAGKTLKASKAAKANPEVQRVAEAYAKSRGIGLKDPEKLAEVSPEVAQRIAKEYETLTHAPDAPEVKKAYDKLIKETLDQYKALKKAGLKVTRIEPGMPNPYKSSEDMMRDIAENKHIYYYPTTSGFGTGKETIKHPLLRKTSEKYQGEPMLANDIFRIVHDYFGHAKKGVGFGPVGEENAWRVHRQMYSPEAARAMTTETRGQNNWVNFGPYGTRNRANPAETIYAEQKAGLLPKWTANLDETGQVIPQADVLPIAVGSRIPADIASPIKVIKEPQPIETALQKLTSGEDIVVPEGVRRSENFQQLMDLIKKQGR